MQAEDHFQDPDPFDSRAPHTEAERETSPWKEGASSEIAVFECARAGVSYVFELR